MAAVVRAGQASMGICLLSCTFVFQSAAVPGGRFSNPPTSPSPVRCTQNFENPNFHIDNYFFDSILLVRARQYFKYGKQI